MILNLSLGLVVIWETIYTLSFGTALFKEGKKTGAIFSFLITILGAILYFIFVSRKIFI